MTITPVLPDLRDAPETPVEAALHAADTARPAALAEPGLASELLRELPAQVVLLDRDLRVQWANEAFCRLCKVPATQIVGRAAADFLVNLGAHSQQFHRAFGGEAIEFPLNLRLSMDGSAYDVKALAKPLPDRSRGGYVVCLLLSDLQRRPQSDEESLSNTAQAMRQVLAALPEFILVLDADLHVLYANRPIQGHPPEQLEGAHIVKFLPPDAQDEALTAMRRTLATGEITSYKAQLVEAAGRSRHFGVRVSPIRRDTSIVALALNAAETTDQVQAARAIATQARMIESMIEGVAVIADSGAIDITNPAFDAMFGYERGELIGHDISSLAGWPVEELEQWRSTPDGHESVTVEFEGCRRNGDRFFAAGVLSGFEIAGLNHRLLVLQDVSERKHLERGILQAVNREQYRIGNDLHDGLGQELTGIALMLRGLAGRLNTEYPPLLPEIDGITRLVSNAIESTRSLARGLSPVNLERGGLQDALEGLAMHATELYAVPIVFTHRLYGNRPLNPELANHLYRIAQEAVRNAVRHGQPRSIRLHLNSVRAKVRLSITDDGVGMPAHAMDAAGMGLKTMRYRARIAGGDVRFEPVEPSGTRVICECPLDIGGAARVRKLPKAPVRP